MTLESNFSEFFQELGGIDNLRLMVNLRSVMYGEAHGCPAVDFTVGWEKRFDLRIIKGNSVSKCGREDKYNYYFVYCGKGGATFLIRSYEVKEQMSGIIKRNTGNEISF